MLSPRLIRQVRSVQQLWHTFHGWVHRHRGTVLGYHLPLQMTKEKKMIVILNRANEIINGLQFDYAVNSAAMPSCPFRIYQSDGVMIKRKRFLLISATDFIENFMHSSKITHRTMGNPLMTFHALQRFDPWCLVHTFGALAYHRPWTYLDSKQMDYHPRSRIVISLKRTEFGVIVNFRFISIDADG